MTFNDSTKKLIRSKLGEYVSMITKPSPKGGRDMWACPICGSGSSGRRDSDGAFHVTGEEWFCHAHNSGGDIFTLYAEINNLDSKNDFPQIMEGLSQELGITAIDSAKNDFSDRKELKTAALPKVEKKVAPEIKRDPEREKQIEIFASMMTGSRAEKYIHEERALSEEVIEHFRLGYNPNRYISRKGKNYETLVIPYPGTDYFTERLIDPGDADKYFNQPGSAPVFIINENKDSKYFYITEGQIDALSMYQVGCRNIIASHYPSKIEDLIESGTVDIEGVVIVADRDEPKEDGTKPGEEIANKLKKIFDSHGIKSIVVYPPIGYKDVNDMLVRYNDEILVQFLSDPARKLMKMKSEDQTEESEIKSFSVKEYFSSGKFAEDIEYFRRYKGRKTGFTNIDNYLTLYPGLACLTGATSLGKTSFCVQLADQLVERGETVLYFTLEQLPIEIAVKSIAREYYLRKSEDAPFFTLTNTDIKNGFSDEDVQEIIDQRGMSESADRFHIVQCDFTFTADRIIKYVEDFITKNRVLPIVIIDYLQILSSPEDGYYDEREKIDDAVKKFKLLSRNYEIFVLMISNMARASYKERIGEDSFKESGLIEYTCDYLWGLQLSILESDNFFTEVGKMGGKKETSKATKQFMIDNNSAMIPKEVVFKSMKNRNGKKIFRAFFKYRPDFDIFIEDHNSRYDDRHYPRVVNGTLLPETEDPGEEDIPFVDPE